MSKKNWFHAAGILWARLADLAVERRTETYSQVAPLIDTNPLSVRHALDLIQRYCLDQRLRVLKLHPFLGTRTLRNPPRLLTRIAFAVR